VRYTSRDTEGQVYIPLVNWAMFFGCVAVTLLFRTAGNLAAAYGIAVTGTMGITTLAFGYVAFYRWNWPLWKILAVCTPLMLVDLLFFFSNLLKFTSGGYFPVMVAAILVAIMVTWQWGRRQLANAFYEFGVRDGKKLEWLVALRDMLDELEATLRENLPFARSLIQGRRRLVESDRAAVFLCSRPIRSLDDYVPVSLRIFLKKYGVLPSHVTLFYVNQVSVPEIATTDRYEVVNIGHDIDSVIVTYGYMEQPDIRGALRELHRQGHHHAPQASLVAGAAGGIVQMGAAALHSRAQVLWAHLRRRGVERNHSRGVRSQGGQGQSARAGDCRSRGCLLGQHSNSRRADRGSPLIHPAALQKRPPTKLRAVSRPRF
jgi:KUP system potassium uptake protein